jgi:hypothetical protein
MLTRINILSVSRFACVIGAALLLVSTASAGTVITTELTAHYKLMLDLTPVETMYTQAQVKANHPTTGEVMLSGMGGMSMGKGNRHLEVHVYSRATGKVLATPPSSITVTDTNAMSGMGMSNSVEPVAMEGIGEGMADLHYGNNVHLTAGHTYRMVVVVKGEKASFTVRA